MTQQAPERPARIGWVRPVVGCGLILLALVTVHLLRARAPKFTDSDLVMGGVRVNVTVWGAREPVLREAVRAAFERIREIDAKMSDYKADSEITRIKNGAGIRPVEVSEETFQIIEKAIAYSRDTGGAFDVTVRPLISLWRERDELDKAAEKIPKENRPPSEEEIRNVLDRVGSHKIILDRSNLTVMLPAAGMAIDLGAIAKGYAVDEAVRVLKEHGVENCLVELGGDLYAAGTNNDGDPWPIGVREPVQEQVLVARTIYVSDVGVTTSGDYERYRVIGGKRFNHILDPRTGRPVEGLHSVTVVARSCMEADVLSTAITVVGVDAGKRLIEKFEAASFYAMPGGPSPGFERYLEER